MRKLLFRRTIHGIINRSRDVPTRLAIDLSFRTTFSTFRCQVVWSLSRLIIFFFLLEYISAIGKKILFCYESWSWKVRIGVDAWPIFPRKMEEVFQKGSLRLRSLVECEKIFSKFHKLEDYFGRFQRKREISKFRDVSESRNDYQEKSSGYSGILSEDTKFKWL